MMSSGGYPFPAAAPNTNALRPRRASGGMPLSYDRPMVPLPRRSQSPGSLRRYAPYDDYPGPGPRSGPAYRDNYRPNAYRPDSRPYRSPSPDRRYNSPRDRSNSWQASGKAWSDGRALTLSPTSSAISRDRVRSNPIGSSRLFEPSDAWKQTQGDRPIPVQSPKSPSVERRGDRMRSFRGNSPPERTIRGRSPSYFARGDRYRPDQNLPENGNGRFDQNSYRPPYRQANTLRPTLGRYSPRRASSPNGSLSSSRSGRSTLASRSRTRSRSASRSASRSRSGDVTWERSPERGRRSISHADSDEPAGGRGTKSRSNSRSSIASSRESSSRHVSPATAPMLNTSSPAVNGQPTFIPASPRSSVASSRPASPVEFSNKAHEPSPIPGIHTARELHAATVNGRHDAVSESLQLRPESPFIIPGLRNTLQNVDVELPRPETRMDQRDDLSSAPLTAQRPEPQPEMGIKRTTKTAPTLPTWDVLPTIPDSPVIPDSPTLEVTPLPSLPIVEFASRPTEPAPRPVEPASRSVEPAPQPAEPVPMPVPERAPSPARQRSIPQRPISPAPLQKSFPPAPPQKSIPPPLPQRYITPPFIQRYISPPPPDIEYVFDDIPRMGDAKSIADALRTVIMARRLRDKQTREERVNPVLLENLSISTPSEFYATPKTQEQLIEEVSLQRASHGIDDPFLAAKSWLRARFDKRRITLNTKKEQLQAEYQSLHKRWRRHCDALSRQQARPVETPDNVPVSGRTTRRSAATLGDTVRSDLEMEQIIASLGYDEATDPNQLSTRNLAIIPDMISVTGETYYTFDDTNYLVENPSEYYAPYTGINDWTETEKELFLDKYAAFPKQFGAIASFLPNKTPSQCVDFYYLHKKKRIDFRRVVSQFAPNKRKRRRTGKQKGNGLLSDIRQHDAEVNGDADDSPSYTGRPTRGRRSIPENRKPSGRRHALQFEATTTATPTPEPEARPKRRRVAATSRSVLFQDDLDDDTDFRTASRRRRNGVANPGLLL
ncbi:hypothetical protein C8F04DRAFT_384857 [Mycena alexandri]|uniref:SANT domain-containing protein n=1 Tax=Mycena alexandri TaxID=1745969 RepID=A0AAD6T1C0_9AGAR|nr:hypothetical protein C8F04DRAFT_384857 [Mycena alexandri]